MSVQIIEAQDLKLIQAQILIDFQLEDNKHKEEEGKRAGEKEISCSILFLIVYEPIFLLFLMFLEMKSTEHKL